MGGMSIQAKTHKFRLYSKPRIIASYCTTLGSTPLPRQSQSVHVYGINDHRA